MRRALTALVLSACACATTLAAEPGASISFEILTRPGAAPTAAQDWYQALTDLKIAGLRIRSGGESDQPDVQTKGTAAAPSYQVTAILAADNMLYVPGGKFSVRDKARLREWLAGLGDAGVEGVTEPRGAFGLLPSQLEAVHDDLKRPLGMSTRGVPAMQVARQIADRVQLRFQLAPGATDALSRVTIQDELNALSCGTALAAVLRPAGLVLKPRRERGGELHYWVGPPTAGEEVWPVGWKPRKRASDEVPALFEMLNVEISEIPVSEAIEAIEGRLKVPLVYDRNAMALHGADPSQVQADVPAKRLSYSQVLSKVLGQAGLRYEVREDEADRPFLWITTLKRAP